MTLVFRTSQQGSLQQVQIGPVDLVATVAAANSAWGWIGGLDGIRNILNYSRPFSRGTEEVSCFGDPKLSPIDCHILVADGVVNLRGEDTNGAYGGDPSTQLLALTLCALSYELGNSNAIELFMQCLAPSLLRRQFGSIDGLREALHSNIADNIDRIVNEGAARGFSSRFYKATSALQFTRKDENTPRYKGWGPTDSKWPSDWYLLGGLLKWVGSGAQGQYCTRSGVVARQAACFREVGYKIAQIKSWNGLGTRPAFHGVLLVTGGTSETDTFIDEGPHWRSECVFNSYYYFATTGAMLLNSLQAKCDIPPEVCQQYYEDIDARIQKQLTIRWTSNPKSVSMPRVRKDDETQVIARWKDSSNEISRLAVRLAAFNFPRSAESMAQFYKYIADESVLDDVKRVHNMDTRYEALNENLVRFRVITACICLSVIGRVAGDNFHSLQHSTRLHLRNPRKLNSLSEEVDQLVSSSLSFTEAVVLISNVHCAVNPNIKEKGLTEEDDPYTIYDSSSIVGCRNGIFAVVPEILLSMSSPISESMLSLRCIDTFIGNVPVQRDCFIRSSRHGSVSAADFDSTVYRNIPQSDLDDVCEAQSVVEVDENIFLGNPILRPPDKRLYLSIERPADFNEPLLGLCGRINGEAFGNIGIQNLLRNLSISLEVVGGAKDNAFVCTTHDPHMLDGPSLRMLNVPASIWIMASSAKPSGEPDVHTYIPVQGDTAWAIFLVGQYHCRLALGCAFCAAESAELSSDVDPGAKIIIIGYS